MVRAAVETAFASKLTSFSRSASRSVFKSFLSGVLGAVFLQSATASILLTTALLSTGMLALPVAMVMILGADLGSAVVTRILFFDLSFLPAVFLVLGILLHILSKTWKNAQSGRILLGLGLMLLSLQLIKQITAPLVATPVSAQVISLVESAPLIVFVCGLLVTWFAHSSVAIILLLASLADVGLISLSLAIAAMLGANTGSALIALPLVGRRNPEAYAAVLTNILLRLTLGIFSLLLLSDIIAALAAGFNRDGLRVVYGHIGFNLMLAIICVPCCGYLSAKVGKFIRSKQFGDTGASYLKPGNSLDNTVIRQSELAIAAARREAHRLADCGESLFAGAVQLFDLSDRAQVIAFIQGDKEINRRNKAIQQYLADARRYVDAPPIETELDQILRFASTIENIGDVVCHSLARLAIKKIDRDVRFSKPGMAELTRLHDQVLKALRLDINYFIQGGERASAAVRVQIAAANALGSDSLHQHRLRLSQGRVSSIGSSSIHQDMVRDMVQTLWFIENREHS